MPNPFVKLWTTFRNTFNEPTTSTALTITPPKTLASGSNGYDASGQGRRAIGWNASRLGPNTLLTTNQAILIARSRDSVRNSALARSAIDKWESNVIGSGIQCHWTHPDPDVRKQLQEAWDRWITTADFNEQLNFYGLQSLVVRELFEAGECFARFHVDGDGDTQAVPLQVQLLESEQCPIFRNVLPGNAEWRKDNWSIKQGIVFDSVTDRRIGYSMYKGQPYDTMFDPMGAAQFIFLPKTDCIHVMRPLRAGQLRGEPQMTAVLTLLYEVENYSDAERVRKKVASMFAGFLTEPSLENSIFPPSPAYSTSDVTDPLTAQTYPTSNDPGTDIGQLQPGTLQKLLPGETIVFPTLPESGDYDRFMYTELHKFAAGCGVTYEQLTGDLKGVNYSSIRAGMLEFRRACEAFQKNIVVNGFCDPVKNRWLKEAVISGKVQLPEDYFTNPEQYEACNWISQGFDWVDPVKEIAAYQSAVRCGFTSRTQVIRETGFSPEAIDNQNAEDNKRADDLGIMYDSNPSKILIGREVQPVNTAPPEPDETEESVSDE